MVWFIVSALVVVGILVYLLRNRKDSRADWTPGNFCTRCGVRHPQDFGSLGLCPRCGGTDYEIRKGPPIR
jgi:hypothetical protein